MVLADVVDSVLAEIFGHISSPRDMSSLELVSRQWCRVAHEYQDQLQWEQNCMRVHPAAMTIKAQPFCALSWKQLFAQRVQANGAKMTRPSQAPMRGLDGYMIGADLVDRSTNTVLGSTLRMVLSRALAQELNPRLVFIGTLARLRHGCCLC